MKLKTFRVTEDIDSVLKSIANKNGMSFTEIIQRGILGVALANDVDIGDATVEAHRAYRKRFTPTEDAKLRELRKDGLDGSEIASLMGRDYHTVLNRCYKLGV